MGKTNAADRKNAAIEKLRQQATVPQATSDGLSTSSAKGVAAPGPLGVPDLFGPYPNWAWSPLPEFTDAGAYITGTGIRKFVNQLPIPSTVTTDGLSKQLPIANPDTVTYPGSDYYEISLEEVAYKFHTDLPGNGTKVRGYRQTNQGTTGVTNTNFNYAGPIIVADKNRPVRVKFTNNLPVTANGGNLFIPTDTSMMGAGKGPNGTDSYPQNRGTLHLHGGMNPWISDGTPHQWVAPGAEPGPYTRGVSTRNVPDMPPPGGGVMTFYYTNQQSARLMFYHDHALGITRLNVYAGEAAGYLVRDDVEKSLASQGIIPPLAEDIPLVIQDRTFVDSAVAKPVYSVALLSGGTGYSTTTAPTVVIDPPTTPGGVQATATATVDSTTGAISALTLTAKGSGYTAPPTVTITDAPGGTGSGAGAYAFVNSILATDPTWDTNTWGKSSDLWLPHVYMPNQTGSALGLGANAMGRWDYAMWFWPPYTGLLNHGLMANPYYDTVNAPWEPAQMPSIPNPSATPEAFHDTPVVNGTAYPYLDVQPKAYRFRILNACNDRMLNLQLYKGDPNIPAVDNVNRTGTEVRMIPVPQGQSVYGKPSGIPDPTMRGPNMIQIGNEGGFLPEPVVLTNTPIGYETNPKNIVVGNVLEKNLFMGPAERADVIIDFSGMPAGTTVILYNDAPAPVPAFETRVDYYLNNPDQTGTGGAPTTLAGFGPNTRTIMQFRVGGGTPVPFNLANLQNAFKSTANTTGAFAASQHPVLVPQAAYSSAYNANFPTTNIVPIQANSLTFTPKGSAIPVTIYFKSKAIQELFEVNYGRLNATLGVELPFTNGQNQTTIPLGYAEPTPDHVTGAWTAAVPTPGDNTQIWKITHNGVDTHPVHFHLFDVQVLNRVGWDGAIRLPDANELGWKDTVRMNPLEDCIVALRPVVPRVPFGLPRSVRLIDPTQQQGVSISTIDPTTGNPTTVLNNPTDYGWEYVWHCHILSHEENDMMHAMTLTPTSSIWGQTELLLLNN
ncbi:multicopper oxidase domain-containing protein [Desulfovibrio sp. TomC]|uniref:multicopper oxidase domain-containing protein n=1 Tax=Desulfovibrio sp. TomC TaxID=1562888 RepID=UPI0018CCFBAE|nr:multicopper oxidase domain-containing protein [Desulfovibrio sp. TomC]